MIELDFDDKEELVNSRHSVRQYKDEKIEQEKVDEINKLIDQINEDENLEIKLKTDEKNAFSTQYGKFENAKNYIVLAGPKDSDEKLGYYGEMLVLKAQELGLNSCFVAATYDKSKVPINLKQGSKIFCIISIGYGKNQGKTHEIKTFEQVSKTKQNYPNWYEKGVEFALKAPTALNQQKFSFELLDDNKVKAKAGFGFYTDIDLGIVKFNFELGAGTDNFTWAK